MREYLAADDEQGIDQFYAKLQDAVRELKRDVRAYIVEYADVDEDAGGSPILSPRRPNPTPDNNSVDPSIDDPFL